MGNPLAIQQAQLPAGSLAAASFHRIDYQDAHACVFSCAHPLQVEEVVRAFFAAAPAWVGQLFALRNRLVKVFGLKVSEADSSPEQLPRFRVEPGERLGLFRVMAKTGGEVLLGENDKHLDFRISFYLSTEASSGHYRLVLSTTVLMHNWFGRLYFLPVKPVHKLIVSAMLKSVVEEVQKKGPQYDTSWMSMQPGSTQSQ
jgi:hypothetical protein